VIVFSALSYFDLVLRAYRGGVAEFFAKGTDSPQLLRATVLRSWDRIMREDSTRILDGRVRALVPHFTWELSHRFEECFTHLIQDVARIRGSLQSELADRFGLDANRDQQDTLVRAVGKLGEAGDLALNDWRSITGEIGEQDGKEKTVTIGSVIQATMGALEPCFIAKRVKPKLGDLAAFPVLSFGQDVNAVVEELFAGALSELPDFPPENEVFTVSTAEGAAMMELSIEDTGKRIDSKKAEQINQGMTLAPAGDFGRAWGLSVVQQTAMRGGGRLEIEPSETGNRIRYLVPRALNA
jgi:hypothetical protein